MKHRTHEPWILAIDAVSSCLGLALAHGHWFRGRFYTHSPLTMIQRFIPAVRTLLSGVEIELEDIQIIAVNRGPGSFTALRIIFSHLLAFQTKVPFRIIATDTLTLHVFYAVQHGLIHENEKRVWSLLPAGRTEFCLAGYDISTTPPKRVTEVATNTWFHIYPLLKKEDWPILYPEPGVVPMAGDVRVIRVHESERALALLEWARQNDVDTFQKVEEVPLWYVKPPPIRS